MSRVNVVADTLSELSNTLKVENEKLLEIVSNIANETINYEDMLISDAGELFRRFMIEEQEKEKNRILLSNQEIADKLLYISNIYRDTDVEIGGLMK